MTRALLATLATLSLVAPAASAQELRVHISMPLQSPAKSDTDGIVQGAQKALQDAGGQAGGRAVSLAAYDSSTEQARTWVPELVARNARRAAEDPLAVGYIGEFNSGASAISIPITNSGGLLQVSPTSTATGLTQAGPGAERGEPAKLYPTGARTFGRIVPDDGVQAAAGATLLGQLGRRRVLVVHDGSVYGKGVAQLVAEGLRRQRVKVTGFRRLSRRGRNARALARLARRGDGLFFGGVSGAGPKALWEASASDRDLVKVGSDGLYDVGFTTRVHGGISRRAGRNTYLLFTALPLATFPPAAKPVISDLGDYPNVHALYGYEAMALILDCINRGGPSREGVLRAFFATRDRDSILGRYSITPTGDTTMTRYGVDRIHDGEVRFDRVVEASPR